MSLSHHLKRAAACGVLVVLALTSCEESKSKKAALEGDQGSSKKQDDLRARATFIADPANPGSAKLTDIDVSALVTDPIAADRCLSKPLLPIGNSDQKEDVALDTALAAYKLSAASGNFSPLEKFLKAFPDGQRSPALRNNLAALYYAKGQFSKSYAMWNEAWMIASKFDSPLGRRMADEAFAGLSKLSVLFGRKEDLEPLLKAVEGREMVGAANEGRIQAYEALESMNRWQEQSFKCGPFALFRVGKQLGLPEPLHPLIQEEKSSLRGTSVAQLVTLSQKMDMPMEFVKIPDANSIPTPSVVHWKMGHYSAVMSRDPDGSYVVDDTTFTQPLHITAEVMRQESTGNYLVLKNNLPSDASLISKNEVESTWGRMSAPERDPNELGNEDPDLCLGMAAWTVGELAVNLRLVDTPLTYVPAVGPTVDFTLTYNARDASQPVIQNYSNVGQKWTFKWLQFIVDDPTQPLANVMRQRRSGGREAYQNLNATTGFYDLQPRSGTKLEKPGSANYILHHPGGGKTIYGLSDGTISGPRKLFITQEVDSSGNATNFQYDANLRLTKIVDATGKETLLSYGYSPDPFRITAVTDPYGRSAHLEYDLGGNLNSITDTIGIQSKFNYSASGDITDLISPYGRTTFETAFAGYIRRLTITDPMGARSRYELTELRRNGTGDIDVPDTLNSTETVNPEVLVPETGSDILTWREKG